MTFPVTKTADHNVSVGSLLSAPIGGEHLFPTYLVTSDATAIGAANALHVQPGTGASWAITAASLPLPSGAATSAKQDSQTTHLATLAGAVTGNEVQVDVLTMPTVNVAQSGSWSVAVSSSALPTGASSAANQATIIAALSSIDGHVDGVEGALTSIDAKITAVNTGAVVVASSALPTGAATAARQDTGNASLSSIDAKLPSLGQALAAASVPVVLTAAQISALTPLSTVAATQSGTWTVGLSAGTNGIGKLTANSGVTIGAVEIAASQTLATVTTVSTVTTLTTLTGGGVAHDGVDSGNPVKIGYKASSSLAGATMVASGDRVDAVAGIDGAQIVRPHCGLEDIVSGVAAITDGSSTSVIAAQGAGVKTYVTTVVVANSSATAVTVDIRDGAAGTVKLTLPVPANTAGVVLPLPVPLPFSANTAVCADPSASASTVTVTLIGFKSKV